MSTRNSHQKRRLKQKVYRGKCCFCRRRLTFTQATIEHVIPLALGGGWEPSNLRVSCSPCNQERGTEEFSAFRERKRQGLEQPC